ncbi:serine hydrolase domain-containing protein [Streptomyces axinellae]|uniref:Serine hydrolase domain-containing protein n=1 Tax=Streptomyces axinellae TaxID=552788 RepID=A0ABP6CNR9_9ACTN
MSGLLAGVGVVAFALAPPVAQAAPAPGSGSPHGLTPAAVDRYVEKYREQTGLPGAAVAVTKGDRVVRAAGYGHTAYGSDVTARTPLPVASLSKSMTALAVMQLAEEGKIDLDRAVHHYLPEFVLSDPRGKRITVRQLLTQTSGMADSSYPDLRRAQPRILREAVAAMRGAGLADAPGARMNYHNPNFFVAARLVEAVSKEPFATHMERHVFGPLGMSRTTTVNSTTDMPGDARGYVRAYGTVFERGHPRWFAQGAHGVVSTAQDLAQWLMTQNGGGVSAEGRRVVSARDITVMHTPTKGEEYAMGWRRSGPPGARPVRIEHTGQLLTHNAIQVLLPGSGVGIAVVTNTGMVSGDDAVQIADGLVALAQGKDPAVSAPFTMRADWVLAAVTLLALGLGLMGVLRARRWAGRRQARSPWLTGLRLLPYALPVALAFGLADLVGLSMRRSGTFAQVTYVWPALVACVLAGALAAGAVMLVRGAWLIRIYRQRRDPDEPSASAPAPSPSASPTAPPPSTSDPAIPLSARPPGPAAGG